MKNNITIRKNNNNVSNELITWLKHVCTLCYRMVVNMLLYLQQRKPFASCISIPILHVTCAYLFYTFHALFAALFAFSFIFISQKEKYKVQKKTPPAKFEKQSRAKPLAAAMSYVKAREPRKPPKRVF